MGLFKRKKIEGIRVIFYEGELQGFFNNDGCQLLLQEKTLRITKINPDITVHLDRQRILDIMCLSESEYMKKYKGTDIIQKKNDIPRSFYILDYLNKEGNKKQLVFWGTSSEALKIMKMQKELSKDVQSSNYEI